MSSYRRIHHDVSRLSRTSVTGSRSDCKSICGEDDLYNLPTTRALLERLATDKSLRRLCGWENKHEVPDEWAFSRAFSEFAKSRLPERVHEALIRKNYAEVLVGHISRDSTAIEAREKLVKKTVTESAPARRMRPK